MPRPGQGGQDENVRDNLRAMAAETMAIIEAGGYRSPGGRDVRIGDAIRSAAAGTRLYLPDEEIPSPVPRGPGRG